MAKSPLELQQNPSFGYTFQNITLLYEALTHSFDNAERKLAKGNVCYKKKTFYRLKTLGISIFKLFCVEQAIRENETTAGPGTLTDYVKLLQSEKLLKYLGGRLKLHEFIEVQNGFPANQIENLYPDVIKAIVGAVFVDSGTYLEKSNMIMWKTQQFLCRLYSDTGYFTKNWKDHPLESYFPLHKVNLVLFLRSYQHIDYVKNPNLLYGIIGYEFFNDLHFTQAMTHGSVKQYDIVKSVEDYQRMEFLGDAVWEAVICEYLFWYYINDDKGTHFNKKALEKFTNETFHHVIAEYIGIHGYLLKSGDVELSSIHMFLESLIGAMYIDSAKPFITARKVIINLCKECTLELLNSGCERLPYDIKRYYSSYYRHTNTIPHNEENLPESELCHNFEIKDAQKFREEWEHFAISKEQHQELIAVALMEDASKSEKPFLPLNACNKAEFARRNPYGLAAEQLLIEKSESKLGTPESKPSYSPESAYSNSVSKKTTEIQLHQNKVSINDAAHALFVLTKYAMQKCVGAGKFVGNLLIQSIQVTLVAIKVLVSLFLYHS